MSDFLVSFGRKHTPKALLKLLQMPYPEPRSKSECSEFPWGTVCLLFDPLSRSCLFRARDTVFAPVGDLLMDDGEATAEGLIRCAAGMRAGKFNAGWRRETDPFFAQLNGAFAALLADETGPAIITDPLGSVQVYAGRNRDGDLTAVGTHPDLVACLTDEEEKIDSISVFEFLNTGTPCFPHTMHQCVQELAPGRLHVFGCGADGRVGITEAVWWPFPAEFQDVPDEEELASSLGKAFTAAVEDRCQNGTVAVTLSGGLDSRLVMSAVPKSTRCIGFTFCDVVNREAQIARRVARCYGREWVPLFRDEEYIARTAMETIRLIGCEGDWVNAHGLGFSQEIARYSVGTVLSGLLMNNNVKGYYAADVHRVPRAWGLLPARSEIVKYDYVNALKPFSAEAFRAGLLEEARARRRVFLTGHPGIKRESVAEWLDGYPFSQASDNTAWVAERRLLPVRLPAMDRRLLDLACRVPMRMKMGGRLFKCMATPIMGRGARIPDANDGVRPGSNHVQRLLQRGIRKVENRGRKALGQLGVRLHVPHSWHDYQRYWQKSVLLRRLSEEHGRNLQEFDVFETNPQQLIADPKLPWEHGLRLVQLALWKSIVREYRAAICGK